MRPLSEQEKEMMWIALGMRKNYIETGDIAWDAATIEKLDKPQDVLPRGVKIKALNDDQMRLILATRELTTKILQGKVFIQD